MSPSHASVAVGPGVTALQRMPSFAYRSATSRESESIAAFVTEYSGKPTLGRFAAVDETLTIAPAPCFCIAGTAKRNARTALIRFSCHERVPRVVVELVEASDLGPADVVHEAVDAAEGCECRLDHTLGPAGEG